MKPLACILAITLAASAAWAQKVTYATDEQCGCDIVYVNGIETTRDGDRYGFRRDDGSVIAENIYKYVGTFEGAYCKVWMDDTLCGLIDTAGQLVVPCLYQEVAYPAEDRILVAHHGLFGFTDMQGNIVIHPQYPNATSFSEGRSAVGVIVDSFFVMHTYIDTAGNLVFPPTYQTTLPYKDGYALIHHYDRWGIIDRDGNEVLHTIYEKMTIPDHGVFLAGDDNGMALFDYSFQPLTPFVYQPHTAVSDNRMGVQRDWKLGFLDLKGNEVVPCIYDQTGRFHLGRTMASIDGRYGIIDTLGNIVLPLEYDNRSTHGIKYMYNDSLALVERGGKLGYADLDGRIAIPLIFTDAYPFREGLAPVKHNGRWGYIDTRGEVYIGFFFDFASPFEWGRAEVIYGDTVSIIDNKGRCVKNCKGIIAWRKQPE